MTELKTLKDLNLRLYRSKSCQLLMRRLRQEAIKWVKDSDKGIKEAKKLGDDDSNAELQFCKGFREAFMDFFDLIEEDLK